MAVRYRLRLRQERGAALAHTHDGDAGAKGEGPPEPSEEFQLVKGQGAEDGVQATRAHALHADPDRRADEHGVDAQIVEGAPRRRGSGPR